MDSGIVDLPSEKPTRRISVAGSLDRVHLGPEEPPRVALLRAVTIPAILIAPEHAIHPTSGKGYSTKLNFAFTAFYEVRLDDRVFLPRARHAAPTRVRSRASKVRS